jgi:hypothetical protein
MSYYVSYDAADRTLAKCFIKINNYEQCIAQAYARLINFAIIYEGCTIDDKFIDEFISCIRKVKCDLQFIKFYDYSVDDIIGKNLSLSNDLERSQLLIKYLNKSKVSIDNLSVYKTQGLKVLIEQQPPINAKSPLIAHCLTTYYLCGGHDVVHVTATNKNKITIHKSFSEYLENELSKIGPVVGLKLKTARRVAKYNARKKHSKETFEEFCNCFGYQYIIKSCSRSVLDDLADSFMQAIAYHYGY